jgi:hypothetical protein
MEEPEAATGGTAIEGTASDGTLGAAAAIGAGAAASGGICASRCCASEVIVESCSITWRSVIFTPNLRLTASVACVRKSESSPSSRKVRPYSAGAMSMPLSSVKSDAASW